MGRTVEVEQRGRVGIIRLSDKATLEAMFKAMVEQVDAALEAWTATDAPLKDMVALERVDQGAAGRAVDRTEGIAAFVAKRTPAFPRARA